MPNDPRVKFKKKIHDLCGNYVHFRASGHGGGVFGGSNFPTPPGPGPDPDPTPTIPIIPYVPPDNPPTPIKPGLDPGGIAGITIASAIAMAAAAALAEQERRRRANRGIPLPTDDIEMTNTRRSRPNLNRGGANPNDRAIVPSSSRSGSGSGDINRGGAVPSSSRSSSASSSSRSSGSAPSSASISRSTSGASTPYDSALSGPRGVPTPFTQAGFTGSGDIRTSAPGIRTPAPLSSGASTPYFDAPSPGFDYLSRAPSGTATPKLPPPPAPEIQGIRDAMQTNLPPPPPPPPPDIPSPPSEISTKTATPGSPGEMIFRLEEAEAVLIKKLANRSMSSVERKQLIQRLESIQSQQKFYNAVERKNLISEAVSKISTQIRKDPFTGREMLTSTPESISRTLNPKQPVGNSLTNDALNASRPTSNIEMQDLTPQAHAQQTQAAAEAMLADLDVLTQTPDPAAIAERNRIISPGGSMEDLTLEISEMIKAQKGPGLFERTMASVNERIQRGKTGASGIVQDLQKMGSRTKIQPVQPSSRTPLSGQATLERARASGRLMPDAGTEMRGSSLRTPIAKGTPLQPQETASGAAPRPAPPISEAEALERAIKQSSLEAGLGYTSLGGESSKGVTAEMLRAEQPSRAKLQPQEPVQGPRTRQGKETVSSEPLPRDYVAPRAKAPVERIVLGAPPPPAPAPAPPPAERPPPRPQEDFGTELQDVAGLTFRDKPLDKFNAMYDLMTERWRAYYSDSIPTAPETMTEIQGKKYVMEQILKEQAANGDPITVGDTNPREITLEEALAGVQTAYDRTDPPVSEEIKTKKSLKPDQKRKLTKQTGLLATEEQRLRPTTLAGEAQARVQSRTSGAVETRARAPAPAPTPAQAPETRTPTGVREQVQAIEARSARAPELRTRAPELRAAPKPPAGSVPPSAPPSAPESEVTTPRESAVREQTPAERAAFAEELTGRLKGPARQKAKINIGKTNPNVRNPLDIFVSPQHRNMPNTELNPRAKSFKGTLTEISARVPRLVPSRTTLINMGAEGGSMVGGFAAGYFSAQKMNEWFAQHPAKNFGEQYGQALATAFVGMAVGSLTQQVLSAVIRRGVNYALTGEMAAIEGAISGGGTAFLTSIGEAVLFTAVGVTTQMLTTKFLEDAGFNHAISRSAGAAVSTYALAETEYYLWAAKGGPLNLAADASLIVSEAMIIGFGIYQTITEYIEGDKEDKDEAAYQAQLDENKRLNEERQRTIDTTIKRNNARQEFMYAYERAEYDFDKALALLTPEERKELGEGADAKDPNGITAFRAQVEAAFDPLLDTTIPEGYKPDPKPLTGEEKLKRDTYNEYITWYIDSINGKNPKPFDINSEGAKLLNRDTGGTWMSAANVHATTSMTMARRTNPLIQEAQEKIVDAFHKDHKTIEEMPYDLVQYATLDPGFRDRYNVYIISEAQTYIYQQYHSGGFTYNDLDPDLVAIANRDPGFRATVDEYYQVIANQMRDTGLSLQKVVELNALATTDQYVKVGELNEARNKIIQAHQAANQEVVDRYNANIIKEISAYGDNFEAIIRNINDQALLSGHTFLYAANRSDLYRQLHMEMPELELVDPDTGTGGTDQPDAPLPGPGKGRKIGDTDLYGYRYELTDEQNQELDELARVQAFSNDPIAMQAAAERIRYRDRYKYEYTDKENAARENLTLDEYYEKYGITAEPQIIEWGSNKTPKEDGKYRYPDGTIVTIRNGFIVDEDLSNVGPPPETTIKYDPTLSSQPDGRIEMPNGAIRTYVNGLVTEVDYPAYIDPAEELTPDQINERERPTITPTEPTDPTEPPVTPVEPVVDPNREPTYQELKIMYPDKYNLFSSTYKSMHSQASQETVDKQTELYLRQQYGKNPVPLPPPVEPTRQPTWDELKLMYPDELKTFKTEYMGDPTNDPFMITEKSRQFLLEQYQKNPRPLPGTTPTTPTTPTDPATLKQGDVKMPDGSTRTYKNGLVVYIDYPVGANTVLSKSPKQINDEEGIRNVTWTPEAPVVTPVEPVVDRNTLLQGRVTWSDRSTRTYIDGKVVSVQYPDGKTGPNIDEINAAEGVQPAKDPGARPKDWMDRFLEEQAQQQKAKNDAAAAAAAAAAAENPEPDVYVNPGANPRYIASKQTPAPQTTAQSLNLAVAPAQAPATTSMPENTTPGIAT